MKAHELLATPEKWTQRATARDLNGFDLSSEVALSKKAVAWCSMGAILACYEDSNIAGNNTAADKYALLRDRVGNDVLKWNDAPQRTHAEVVAVLRELDI